MKDSAYVAAQNESLATKLKRYRLLVGFTQKNVAEVLNVCRSTYTYYELGKTSPDPATLNRIAKLFDVPLEEFFDDEVSLPELCDSKPKQRVPKKTKVNPEKIGDLTTSEKSIVAFLRDRGISPDDALIMLKDCFNPETGSGLY